MTSCFSRTSVRLLYYQIICTDQMSCNILMFYLIQVQLLLVTFIIFHCVSFRTHVQYKLLFFFFFFENFMKTLDRFIREYNFTCTPVNEHSVCIVLNCQQTNKNCFAKNDYYLNETERILPHTWLPPAFTRFWIEPLLAHASCPVDASI